MKTTILGFLLVLITASTFVQSTAVDREILKLSKDKWQWMANKNVDKLKDLFDDNSMFVHMGGYWGKERGLEVIGSGGIHYKKADIHEASVRIIDNTAIVLNRITLLAAHALVPVTNQKSHLYLTHSMLDGEIREKPQLKKKSWQRS